MKRLDWRERRTRTKNWTMEGRGRYRLGMAGRPRERVERERKTKDWSGVNVGVVQAIWYPGSGHARP